MDHSAPVNRSKPPVWITVVGMLVAGVIGWLKYSGRADDLRQHEPLPPPAQVSTIPAPHSPAPMAFPTRQAPSVPTEAATDDSSLLRAIRSKADEAVVQGSGRVVKLLPDDNDGLRHQKLLVAVGGGGTILIAHNIDLAPRIAADAGDTISFKGIYIWNDRGGVVHWTHHDPSGRHPAGWVKVNGRTFE